MSSDVDGAYPLSQAPCLHPVFNLIFYQDLTPTQLLSLQAGYLAHTSSRKSGGYQLSDTYNLTICCNSGQHLKNKKPDFTMTNVLSEIFPPFSYNMTTWDCIIILLV